jgi:DNA modification methylase
MPSSITCLGKTFATEDERRSYFRDELRQKLPELRKIEGFPIGTEDDILNISDPPYFTACPNPWLNDFIVQWEVEKKNLEKNKKRRADFEVHEPYACDVSEGKNNPIYNAHSYHTKVPHPAIMRYILHYTQPGDIVFDGFAGTGMTGVAAQICGYPDPELKFQIETEFRHMGLSAPVFDSRNAIVGDISPIASFIAHNYNTPVNSVQFEEVTRALLSEVEAECSWMYVTKHTDGKEGRINYTVWSDVFICPSCGGEIIFWNVAVDKEDSGIQKEFQCPGCNSIQTKRTVDKAKITVFDQKLDMTITQSKSVPVLIDYNYQNKRFQKKLDTDDHALIKKIEKTEIPYWYPTDRMPEGDESRRNDDAGLTHVHHFYSRRALYVLSCLYSKAKPYTNQGKAYAEFVVEQAAIGLTKLNRYSPHHYSQVNRNLAGTLYVGSQTSEVSPRYLLEGKLKRLPKAFSLIRKKQIVSIQSAENYSLIPPGMVDYIFTDPPFGANLMYSELNFIWESWLKVITNNRSEAIENKTQGKSLLEYQNIMVRCFHEYFRILKPGNWMTVEFSNTSAAVWNGIQAALQRAGFILANVSALDKQQGSFKAVTTPTAVKQDLVISCYKPSNEFDNKFRTESSEVNTWSFIEEHLKHLPVSIIKEQKTTAVIERSPKILYDRLITFYLMRGLSIPIDAADFQIKLKQKFKESDGMFFTAEQYAQYENQKIKQGITPQLSLVFDIIYSESDAVEWLKARLGKVPQKYQDIQPDFRKANTATRKGEKEFELMTLLSENFIPLTDGRWRTPDMNEAKDREHFRTAALIKEFNKYIEELSDSKTKKLKDVRVESLRAGFKASWEKKDYGTIVHVAENIPQNLLMEDEQLLMFYDIAKDRV